MTDDTRDCVIRLETRMEKMWVQLNDMQQKVNAMRDLLMQAPGVRWLVIAITAIAGFCASIA
jgi:hypothetical protein